MTMPLAPETSGTLEETIEFAKIWENHRSALLAASDAKEQAKIEQSTHADVKEKFYEFLTSRHLPSNNVEVDLS